MVDYSKDSPASAPGSRGQRLQDLFTKLTTSIFPAGGGTSEPALLQNKVYASGRDTTPPNFAKPAVEALGDTTEGLAGMLTSPLGIAGAAFPPLMAGAALPFTGEAFTNATLNTGPRLRDSIKKGDWPQAAGDAIRLGGDMTVGKVGGTVPGEGAVFYHASRGGNFKDVTTRPRGVGEKNADWMIGHYAAQRPEVVNSYFDSIGQGHPNARIHVEDIQDNQLRKYLDMDAKMYEQSPEILDQVQAAAQEYLNGNLEATGRDLATAMEQRHGQIGATEALSEDYDIPGNIYKDQGSRYGDIETPTRNVVTFPNTIRAGNGPQVIGMEGGYIKEPWEPMVDLKKRLHEAVNPEDWMKDPNSTLYHVHPKNALDIFRNNPDRGLLYVADSLPGAQRGALTGAPHATSSRLAPRPGSDWKVFGANLDRDRAIVDYAKRGDLKETGTVGAINWQDAEHPGVQKRLREAGYDAVLVDDETGDWGAGYGENRKGSIAMFPEAMRRKMDVKHSGAIDNVTTTIPNRWHADEIGNPIRAMRDFQNEYQPGSVVSEVVAQPKVSPVSDSGDLSGVAKQLGDKRKAKEEAKRLRDVAKYDAWQMTPAEKIMSDAQAPIKGNIGEPKKIPTEGGPKPTPWYDSLLTSEKNSMVINAMHDAIAGDFVEMQWLENFHPNAWQIAKHEAGHAAFGPIEKTLMDKPMANPDADLYLTQSELGNYIHAQEIGVDASTMKSWDDYIAMQKKKKSATFE